MAQGDAPALLPALADVLDRYDAIFCDIWGCIHNGEQAFPSALSALMQAKAAGLPVVLVSNAPRPGSFVRRQLARLSVDERHFDAVVTSGDAIRQEFVARAGSRYHRIGPSFDANLYEGFDLEFGPPETADAIICTGLEREDELPESYLPRLEGPAARGVPFLCANPDRVVHVGDRLYWCAGAIADVYSALGGPVVMGGKPYGPIYELARRSLREHGWNAPGRVLAIGDGIPTDVLGAMNEGIDCLFIAGGIHQEVLNPDRSVSVQAVRALLEQNQARATWTQASLR